MAGQDIYKDYSDEELARIRQSLVGDEGGPTIVQQDTKGAPIRPESMVSTVANAIARSLGSTGAGMGDSSPKETQPPPQTTAIRLYDDKTEAPKRSLKEMAAYGLIPLISGLAGGLMNGQQGAYAGASSGLNALKDKVDGEDANYQKVKNAKELNRSHLMTAKLIKDLGGGADGTGGSINKARYVFKEGINTETGEPLFLKADKQDGTLAFVSPDGHTIPYTAEIYKRWRPTGGDPTAAPTPAASSAPQPSVAPKPVPAKQTAPGASFTEEDIPTPAVAAKPATKLPAEVKGAEKAPDITTSAVIPGNITKAEASEGADTELEGILAQKDAEIEAAKGDTDTRLRPGENNMDAERRAAAAIKTMAEARKAKDKAKELATKFKQDLERDKEKQNFQKDFAKYKSALDTDRQKDVNAAKPGKAGPVPGADPFDSRVQSLKGTDRTHFDQAVMGLRAADDMAKALKGGSNTFSIIGDNPFTIAARNWNEAIGRLQSGGAINKEEEGRFRKMAPGALDAAPIQVKKINEMMSEMSARINSFGLDPTEALKKRRALDSRVSGGTDPAIEASKDVMKDSTNGVWMEAPDGHRQLVAPEKVKMFEGKGAKKVEGAK